MKDREDEALKRSPPSVSAPGDAGPAGSGRDERRALTPGDPGVPDDRTSSASNARRVMAGYPHGQRGGLSGDAMPPSVAGGMREGMQRDTEAGIPEAAMPLADRGQGRD